MKIKDVISGTKKRLSRNSRQRRHKQGDSIKGIDHISNLSEGARIDHVEDLVLWQGSKGIDKSIATLKSLEHSPQATTIKWDGKPAVIFGRNAEGEFILTDKSGFGAKTYDGKVTSPDALFKMLAGRKGDNRQAYAEYMRNLWPYFEGATPKDFRGYVHGDLLYGQTPKEEKGKITFQPNTTAYHVNPRSAIGKKIAQSKAGVVLHAKINLDGTTEKVDANNFMSGELLVMPPQTVQQPADVDVPALDELESYASKFRTGIDNMLNVPADLKVSDFAKIIYAYINASTKTGNLGNIGLDDFVGWLQTSKVSVPKQQRIIEYLQKHNKSFAGMFEIISGIQKVKNQIIDQLDKRGADITATTDGNPGGEGYVVGSDVKLVNRSGFSAANARMNQN